MEPEGLVPHSQAPATCPYPEPQQSSLRHPFLLLEDPLIPSTPRSSKWCFSVTFPYQNLVYVSLLPMHAMGLAYFILVGLITQTI
jgi:hypothetical protein